MCTFKSTYTYIQYMATHLQTMEHNYITERFDNDRNEGLQIIQCRITHP